MHTEKEAAERWCPFARVEGEASRSVAGNRWDTGGGSEIEKFGPMENPKAARCIGSRCMAWRWNDGALSRRCHVNDADPMATVEPARPAHVPPSYLFEPHEDDEPACWVEPKNEAQARSRGYCGLAGPSST